DLLVDPLLRARELRQTAEELVQLLRQEELVDRERAEAARMAEAQVLDDPLDELRVIGPAKAREQVAPASAVLVLVEEVLERRVLEAGEVARVASLEGARLEGVVAHARRVERGRVARLRARDLALVVERHAELAADPLEARLRVLRVAEEGLAVADLLDARRLAVAFDPRLQHRLDLAE